MPCAPRKNILIVRLGDAPDKDVNWPLVIHDEQIR
jgi:hypothetical protein